MEVGTLVLGGEIVLDLVQLRAPRSFDDCAALITEVYGIPEGRFCVRNYDSRYDVDYDRFRVKIVAKPLIEARVDAKLKDPMR